MNDVALGTLPKRSGVHRTAVTPSGSRSLRSSMGRRRRRLVARPPAFSSRTASDGVHGRARLAVHPGIGHGSSLPVGHARQRVVEPCGCLADFGLGRHRVLDSFVKARLRKRWPPRTRPPRLDCSNSLRRAVASISIPVLRPSVRAVNLGPRGITKWRRCVPATRRADRQGARVVVRADRGPTEAPGEPLDKRPRHLRRAR